MTEKEVKIHYKKIEEWLACPNCQSRDAKLERGSLQLYCPKCNQRQELIENDQ